MTDYLDLGPGTPERPTTPPELPPHVQREVATVRDGAAQDARQELRSVTTWIAMLEDEPPIGIYNGIIKCLTAAWQASEGQVNGEGRTDFENASLHEAAAMIREAYVEHEMDEAERVYLRGRIEGVCDEG